MPIYTDNPCDDGAAPFGLPLVSSLGVNPRITKAIDASTKDWLDKHPEATTTVEDDSLTNAKFMDGSVNSRVIEDGSITTDDIADLAITTPKIANNSVTATKIASSAADGLRTMSTTQPGVAKVGAGLAIYNGAIELNADTTGISGAVTAWLNAHPEATTTVQDNSINGATKLIDGSIPDSKLVQSGGVLEAATNNIYSDEVLHDILLNKFSLASVAQTLTFTSNKYIHKGNVEDIANASFAVTQSISVTSGDIVQISASTAYGNSFYSFFDHNDNPVQFSKSYKTGSDYIENKILVVPKDAETLVISKYGSGSSAKCAMATITINDILNAINADNADVLLGTIGYSNFDTLLKNSVAIGDYESVSVTYPNTDTMINAGSGALETISDVSASNMIDCKDWVGIKYTGRSFYSSCCVAFYQADGTHIISYPSNGATPVVRYTDETIPIPSNAKYVRFGNNISVSGGTIAIYKASSLSPAKEWSGKKWCVVGDSITEANSRTTMNYHDYIADDTGITVINMGQSGTGYKRTEDQGMAFYQRISSVPTDSDVVTIFGSGNDMSVPRAEGQTFVQILGEASDTGTSTICGCINTTIDNLYAIMPTVHLGIITPSPWKEQLPWDTTCPMYKISDKIVEICKRRSIPCLDLYRCSNLRPWDATFRSLAYSNDGDNGVHPDETGHKLIAGMIKSFIASLFIVD